MSYFPLAVFINGAPDEEQELFRRLVEEQLFEMVQRFKERHPLADTGVFVCAFANCLSEILEEHPEPERATVSTQVLEYIRGRILGRLH